MRGDKIMNTPELFRILYVARNESDGELLRALLDHPAIEIVLADTFAGALGQIQNGRFSLYLLETRLPDGDGFELCKIMRELTPSTPVVFYSGDAGEVYRQKGLAAGADVYLAKPYLDSLTTTISEFII
jgi:two-component system, OmpR family, response regulator VanR